MVADRVSRLRNRKEERGVIDDEASCFVTKGSPNGDAAKPEHDQVVIVCWGNTEAETRTEDTTPSTVLNMDEESVAQDPSILKEF